MLNKYEEFFMLFVHFNEIPLISSIGTETEEVQDPNIAKEPLRSKQIKMGSSIKYHHLFICSRLEYAKNIYR